MPTRFEKLVVGIAGTALLLLGWGAFQLYSLNREVGEVKAKLGGVEKRLDITDDALRVLDGKWDGDMDRITDILMRQMREKGQ